LLEGLVLFGRLSHGSNGIVNGCAGIVFCFESLKETECKEKRNKIGKIGFCRKSRFSRVKLDIGEYRDADSEGLLGDECFKMFHLSLFHNDFPD
jgi:hypothetical protein